MQRSVRYDTLDALKISLNIENLNDTTTTTHRKTVILRARLIAFRCLFDTPTLDKLKALLCNFYCDIMVGVGAIFSMLKIP